MKKLSFLLISTGLLFFSCNNDNEEVPAVTDLYGEWEIEYVYSNSVSITPDDYIYKADLNFISTLKFHNDGTVRKEVIGEDIEMSAIGEFVIQDVSSEITNSRLKNAKTITVTYSETSENFRTSSCYQDTESYYLLPGEILENREWSPCDGPIESYLKL